MHRFPTRPPRPRQSNLPHWGPLSVTGDSSEPGGLSTQCTALSWQRCSRIGRKTCKGEGLLHDTLQLAIGEGVHPDALWKPGNSNHILQAAQQSWRIVSHGVPSGSRETEWLRREELCSPLCGVPSPRLAACLGFPQMPVVRRKACVYFTEESCIFSEALWCQRLEL